MHLFSALADGRFVLPVPDGRSCPARPSVHRTAGALVVATVLALASSAAAQTPSESAWKALSGTWVEICATPCRVINGSSYAARLAVGNSVPVTEDAPAGLLTAESGVRDFPAPGLKVYGRAFSQATRVVAEPYGGSARATSTGALEPPTAPAGKLVDTLVNVPANASTQLVPANAARIGLEIQCDGTGIVGLDLKGGPLASVAGAPRRLPAVPLSLYTAPYAPLTAVTAYTGTAQACWVAEWLR